MTPNEPSKRVRKLLREAAGVAYERELNASIRKLDAEFDRWRKGELSPWALANAIHAFHQGPNRKLYLRYQDHADMNVGAALARGILREDDLDPELLAHVRPLAEMIRGWDRRNEEPEETEEEEEDE